MKEVCHRYAGGEPNAIFRGAELRLSPQARPLPISCGELNESRASSPDLERAPPLAAGRGAARPRQLPALSGAAAPRDRAQPRLARVARRALSRAPTYRRADPCSPAPVLLVSLAPSSSGRRATAASAPEPLGGPGIGLRAVCLNLDEPTSAALAAGLKARGAAPFAGLVHAAVTAHREVLGHSPYGVVQQARPPLDLRLISPYALLRPLLISPRSPPGLRPEGVAADARLRARGGAQFGGRLADRAGAAAPRSANPRASPPQTQTPKPHPCGCNQVQRIDGAQEYTLDAAQRGYATLLSELEELDGAVRPPLHLHLRCTSAAPPLHLPPRLPARCSEPSRPRRTASSTAARCAPPAPTMPPLSSTDGTPLRGPARRAPLRG